MFDMDLYIPTRYAADFVLSRMRECDVLYFDEAFDSEAGTVARAILDESPRVAVLAHSATSLAYVVVA